jgi:tagaturonate reductase
MKLLNRNTVSANLYTERILQFGEGNFLRAFVDWIIHQMNEKINFDAGIVVVQPIAHGLIETLNNQEGLYTLYLKGIKHRELISEHQVIDCIQRAINPYENHDKYLTTAENPNLRFIISNTTEAGIAYDASDKFEDKPQRSFPGKLTALLYKRFQFFKGNPNKGLIIIPCELIDRNGDNLKKIILKYVDDWNLGNMFKNWLLEYNFFCNTLVDRIVPGFPKDDIEEITQELGYKDNLVVVGEQFHLWVIEMPESVRAEFPVDNCGLNVVFTEDLEPYRTRKVRILNGVHTAMVPFSLLYGNGTVKETIEDVFTGDFIKKLIYDEIIPTLKMDKDELVLFADEVLDRFRNPFIKHHLSSIALNSISKFKVRVLPSLLTYIEKNDRIPINLTFAFACLIRFYKDTWQDKKLPVNDSEEIVTTFTQIWELDDFDKITNTVLGNTILWNQDLTKVALLLEAITLALVEIETNGIRVGYENFSEKN